MKFLVIIGDGMADLPESCPNGKTPLMVAKKPYMDMMAKKGLSGRFLTIPEGFEPGSDVACLSLFGYDPKKYYTGRGPIEAAGLGIELEEEDVAFRCNLVRLKGNEELIMEDYSADHISDDEAKSLIGILNEKIGDERFKFFAGISYRNICIWKKGMWKMHTTPPHDIMGKKIKDYLPRGEGAQEVINLMEKAREIMAKAGKKANGIWLWGQGLKSAFPSFYELFGLKGGVVCAVDLIKGIGRLAKMEVPKVPFATGSIDTDYQSKARMALRLLPEIDVVYIHVEAPDEASHMGDYEEKVKAIEAIDREIVGFLFENAPFPLRFLITTDHATPIELRTHMATLVPFAIFEKGGEGSGDGLPFHEGITRRIYEVEEVLNLFFNRER